MLVRTGSMEDDDSWEVDHFEATSDDEGGILIVPVSSDNSVSGQNDQTVIPILYFPNQDSPRPNESESQDTEEEEVEVEDETPLVLNEAPSSQVEDEGVSSPDMFGLASNPRRLMVLLASLALLSTVLLLKSFYDHVRYRELEQAAKEKEILMEQIRRLQDENDKLHQESCWADPAGCGSTFFAKSWESVTKSATYGLEDIKKLILVDRVRLHQVPFPDVHSAINSAVDSTLDRVGKWKDTAMRKAVSNQEKLSKKFSSLAGFASERFRELKVGDTFKDSPFNPKTSGLSIPAVTNSTTLQTLLNSSLMKSAALGTVATLLVGAMLELEQFVGEV